MCKKMMEKFGPMVCDSESVCVCVCAPVHVFIKSCTEVFRLLFCTTTLCRCRSWSFYVFIRNRKKNASESRKREREKNEIKFRNMQQATSLFVRFFPSLMSPRLIYRHTSWESHRKGRPSIYSFCSFFSNFLTLSLALSFARFSRLFALARFIIVFVCYLYLSSMRHSLWRAFINIRFYVSFSSILHIFAFLSFSPSVRSESRCFYLCRNKTFAWHCLVVFSFFRSLIVWRVSKVEANRGRDMGSIGKFCATSAFDCTNQTCCGSWLVYYRQGDRSMLQLLLLFHDKKDSPWCHETNVEHDRSLRARTAFW